MSQEQADDLKEQAFELFGILTEHLGHSHWDWVPVAKAAFDAAQAFNKEADARLAPQSAVQADPTGGSASTDPSSGASSTSTDPAAQTVAPAAQTAAAQTAAPDPNATANQAIATAAGTPATADPNAPAPPAPAV